VGALPRPVPMLCYSRAGWDSVGAASTSASPVFHFMPCICSCWMPVGGGKNTDLTAPAAFPVEICWSAAWKSDISTDLASLQRCTTGPPIRTARRAAVDDSAPRRRCIKDVHSASSDASLMVCLELGGECTWSNTQIQVKLTKLIQVVALESTCH
jgi:hypothetical protein